MKQPKKGFYAKLPDFDKDYLQEGAPRVLVNDFDTTTIEGKEALNKLLVNYYSSDTLSMQPRCSCGKSIGRVGLNCLECGTPIECAVTAKVESIVWLRTPKHIHRFIKPVVLAMLSKLFQQDKNNLLEWVLNPYSIWKGHDTVELQKLKAHNLPRGLNAFYTHFETYKEVLFKPGICPATVAPRNEMLVFLNTFKQDIFCEFLPVPSKVTFIVEETSLGNFADHTMNGALDAIKSINSVEFGPRTLKLPSIENRVVKALYQLESFSLEYQTKNVDKKESFLRKHVFGTRVPFSIRNVVTSRWEPHHYECIKPPWGTAIDMMALHLENIYQNRGMGPSEIENMLAAAHYQYSDQLYEDMMGLLRGFKNGYGFPTGYCRNPTLDRLSFQMLFIDDICKDPNIKSLEISVLILKGPNCDFDGDVLGGQGYPDEHMYNLLEVLRPHYGSLDQDRPRAISSAQTLPAELVCQISNWLEFGEDKWHSYIL